jgi:hypothetical protein
MTGDFGAAMDVATGAVIARAIEPGAGESTPVPSGACLNCSQPLTGRHCHNCGQKGQVHRTLRSFGHEILHGVFHFDSKMWNTLPMLAWNPGHLTRRYIHGERAKFVSPLALFLFTVFLTFAVFSSLSHEDANPKSTKEYTKQFDDNLKQKKEALQELEQEFARADTDASDKAELAQDIKEAKEAVKTITEKNAMLVEKIRIEQAGYDTKIQTYDRALAGLKLELAAAQKAGTPVQDLENKIESEEFGRSLVAKSRDAVNDPSTLLSLQMQDANFFWGNASLNNMVKHALENPKLLLYKLQSNTYKFSWALIPISIPFVWLLFFWKRRFKLFDHAIFVTYSITFMMFLSAIFAVIITFDITNAFVMLPVTLYPFFHMYRQLKQAYELSWFGALWRTVTLMLFAIMALSLFAALVLVVGITG